MNGKFECSEPVANCSDKVICPNNMEYFQGSSCQMRCGDDDCYNNGPYKGCGCAEGLVLDTEVHL